MKLLAGFEINSRDPYHENYPEWPGGHRFIQLYETVSLHHIVLTNGLSDGGNHPYELYIDSDEHIGINEFSSSWQANIIYESAKIMPRVHDLKDRLADNQFLCLQIDIDGAPDEWSLDDANGNIGLFLGLPNHEIMQGFEFIPLNIKLMRPAELQYAIDHNKEGRIKLAQLYVQQGDVTVSNLDRPSVL